MLLVLVGDMCLMALGQLDLYLLSQKWKELLKKARAKQLQPNDYNSGIYCCSLNCSSRVILVTFQV